jgi:hypothetical protein
MSRFPEWGAQSERRRERRVSALWLTIRCAAQKAAGVCLLLTLYSRHHMRCRASELVWGQRRSHLVHTSSANWRELSYL